MDFINDDYLACCQTPKLILGVSQNESPFGCHCLPFSKEASGELFHMHKVTSAHEATGNDLIGSNVFIMAGVRFGRWR